jgi:hypothetical protein
MENEDKKDFAGKNGFIWFTGIVEDRKDPLKLGRCKVRCVGWHAENKMLLPTDSLPWAMPLHPVNHNHTFAAKEGDMVFGFFLDGENAQNPAILGIFPNIPLKSANIQEGFNDPRKDGELSSAPRTPQSKQYIVDGTGITITEKPKAELHPRILDEPTTSRIARNDSETIKDTFIQERKDNVVKEVQTYDKHDLKFQWDEPETKHNSKYPYNDVRETESGHIQEFDDTPGAERIHTAHRNGTFEELYPNGDRVHKITRDNYTVVMKDDNVYVMGQCRITVQGDAEIYVKKNVNMRVDQNVTALVKQNVDFEVEGNVVGLVKGNVDATVNGNVTALVKGNADVTVNGNVNVKVDGNYNEQVGGTYTVRSGGNMRFTAPRIDIN